MGGVGWCAAVRDYYSRDLGGVVRDRCGVDGAEGRQEGCGAPAGGGIRSGVCRWRTGGVRAV